MRIDHAVRVFVYHFADEKVQYLLLRPKPITESFWGPVHGGIEPSEDLQRAVLRNVREGVGLNRFEQVVDLQMREVSQFGDYSQVEWLFGFQAPAARCEIEPSTDVADALWTPFVSAYDRLDADIDRRAVMRLQSLLAG